MFKLIFISICSSIFLLIVPASFVDGQEKLSVSAEAFGTLPNIQTIKISPDGTKILMLKNHGGEVVIAVRSLSDKTMSEIIIPPNKGKYNWAEWASDERILASVRFPGNKSGGRSHRLRTERRLLTMSWDGKKVTNPILPLKSGARYNRRNIVYNEREVYQPQIQDLVVDLLKDEPDHILLQLDIDKPEEPAVYKVNIKTKTRRRILRGRRAIDWWIADSNHIVRYGEGTTGAKAGNKVRRLGFYRKSEKSEWASLFDYDEITETRPFYFAGFSKDPNIIYIKALNKKTEKLALYTYDISDHEIVEKIAENENFDIDNVIMDENGELEYYTYFDEKPRYVYFKSEGQALNRKINDYFPNSSYSIINKSKDKNKIILEVTSPQVPISFYLYNLENDEIILLESNYRELDTGKLSEMKKVSYQARDGLIIPGYLSLPKAPASENLPTVILPHGGPQSRDSWGFNYWTQFLTTRGYAVLQMNFRGSTGYGEAFRDLGFHEWGRKMLEDINDGTKWMIEQGIADPNRICIAGASYGGYAALQTVVKNNSLYKCSVAFAPMTDITSFLDGLKNDVNYKSYENYIKSDDWSFADGSPSMNINSINVPVLLAHGENDLNVKIGQSKSFFKKMKNADKKIKYIEFKDGDHFLDNQNHRIQFLREMEMFLAEHL